MAGNDEMKRWVIRVRVADRAGALTSIASAFSNRGVSIDTVVGHSHALSSRQDGTVVVTFSCTEAEKDAIVRIVKLLSKVVALEEHPYESTSLRKGALIRVTRRLTPRDVAGREAFLTCELVREAQGGFVYFMAGSPYELDPVLTSFTDQRILADIVFSVFHI
jgi:acetolactate synthase small subunit